MIQDMDATPEVELFQAYDQQGSPVVGQGLARSEIWAGGLHGAAHVWVWRRSGTGGIEILVQRRASQKPTWPDKLDISVGGHIDLGETPLQAAVREVKEEIGVDIPETALLFVAAQRCTIAAPNGAIENEVRFIYLAQWPDKAAVTLQAEEVSELTWKPLAVFEKEVLETAVDAYVPQGEAYFKTLLEAIRTFLPKS